MKNKEVTIMPLLNVNANKGQRNLIAQQKRNH